MSNTLGYRLSMPAADALARIVEVMDDEHRSLTLTGYAGTRPFLGSVSGAEFRLRTRRSHRNGFAPILYGQVQPEGDESRLTGRFRLPLGTRWALAGLSLFLLVVLTILFITDVRRIGLDVSQLWILVIGAGVALGWYLTMQFGQLLVRKDKPAMRCLLDGKFTDALNEDRAQA